VLLHDPEPPPINTLYLAARAGREPPPAVAEVRDELRHAAQT